MPRFVSSTDPAAHWTGAHGGRVVFAYPTSYQIDAEHAVTFEVEATNAIRQAEVLIAKRTIECRRSYFAAPKATDRQASLLRYLAQVP